MKAMLLPVLLALPFTSIAGEPEVTLAGLQAVLDDGDKDFDGFKTFNQDKGINIALIVRSPDKDIIGFDDDKAALVLGGVNAKPRFFAKIADSRKALRLEFEAGDGIKLEPDGSVKVTGTIQVTFATGKEETRSEVFAVAEGTEIRFADDKKGVPALKVKASGKPKFGDAAWEIELSTDRKPDDIAGIRFYTRDGKTVDSKRSGSSWMSFAGKGSGTIGFTFEKAPVDLIAGVENWIGLEQKTLTVDLSAGLAGVK
jgi:hypothetical protein